MTKTKIRIALAFVAFSLCGPITKHVAADTYGVSGAVNTQVQNFFDGATGFLVKTVGSGVFVLGLIVAGIKIAGGDQAGLRNAVMVMIGGALIFLAKPLVGILSKIAGSV